ncbi:hypothetical protein HHK36_008305 [Tetracentron sinense]|uniref:UBP-type domain-containing protein n=1 Tax=Tetracentron sinense TaxID=13715 RepID=A0A834ZFA4_TETSI|nr:hypothetical protein HHK36_008305 [Tetracentron sinense]
MAKEASSSSAALDQEEEDFSYGAESGWVEARTSCDHLASLSSDLSHIPTPDTPCISRFVNKHMLEHYLERNHCLALSYSDLSVWCFSCDAYLDAQMILQLRSIYETAYLLKFGEAPPFRTIACSQVCDNQAEGKSSNC